MQPGRELSASLRQWLRHAPKWVVIWNSFLLSLNHIIVLCIHHKKVVSCGSKTYCSWRECSWGSEMGLLASRGCITPCAVLKEEWESQGFLTVQCEHSQVQAISVADWLQCDGCAWKPCPSSFLVLRQPRESCLCCPFLPTVSALCSSPSICVRWGHQPHLQAFGEAAGSDMFGPGHISPRPTGPQQWLWDNVSCSSWLERSNGRVQTAQKVCRKKDVCYPGLFALHSDVLENVLK